MSVDPGSARGRLGGAVGRSCTEQPRAKLAKEASGPESGIVIRGSNKTVLSWGPCVEASVDTTVQRAVTVPLTVR